MYILILKETKQIKSFSSSPIEYDKNIFELKEVVDDNLNGNTCYFKKNNIEKVKIKNKDEIKKDFYNKIDKAKDINELKLIIKELI